MCKEAASATKLGAWGKPLVVREKTPEEALRERENEARRKREREAAELNFAANALANRVEVVIASRDGGASGNYAGDEQYQVKGTYNEPVILLAFTKWKEKYSASDIQALNIHMLGPSEKWTGNRNGKKQANFLRKISSANRYKFNIHIDAE